MLAVTSLSVFLLSFGELVAPALALALIAVILAVFGALNAEGVVPLASAFVGLTLGLLGLLGAILALLATGALGPSDYDVYEPQADVRPGADSAPETHSFPGLAVAEGIRGAPAL